MNHDDKSERSEQTGDEQAKPKRLVLNKRVIKHLVVKSNVRTGLSGFCEDGAPYGTRCCTNHNATKIRRRG
jgi:hypothetical protein